MGLDKGARKLFTLVNRGTFSASSWSWSSKKKELVSSLETFLRVAPFGTSDPVRSCLVGARPSVATLGLRAAAGRSCVPVGFVASDTPRVSSPRETSPFLNPPFFSTARGVTGVGCRTFCRRNETRGVGVRNKCGEDRVNMVRYCACASCSSRRVARAGEEKWRVEQPAAQQRLQWTRASLLANQGRHGTGQFTGSPLPLVRFNRDVPCRLTLFLAARPRDPPSLPRFSRKRRRLFFLGGNENEIDIKTGRPKICCSTKRCPRGNAFLQVS